MSDTPKITTISAEEAAKLTGLSKPALYEGARNGEIPCRIVGRRYIFVLEVLERWLQLQE
jgi:excisionase family DNA binding protein